MFFIYGFGFLTLNQSYLCRSDPTSAFVDCSREIVCEFRGQPGFEFVDNIDAPEYTQNWIQELELMCTDRTTINYIIQAYTVFYTVAGLLLFTQPDRLGPKKTMMIFGSIHIGAQFVIIFVPNYYVRVAMMGVVGLG